MTVGGAHVVGNLRKFHRLIGTAAAGAVETHALRHDSSRWIGQVLHDEESTDPRRKALETVGLRPCDGVG